VYGVGDVGEQLVVGASRASVEQHLDAAARPRSRAEHADRARNDERPRRRVFVVRPERTDSLDLGLVQLDPRRTADRLVVEMAERQRRRADVAAAVLELVERVDQLPVRSEQVTHTLTDVYTCTHGSTSWNSTPSHGILTYLLIQMLQL